MVIPPLISPAVEWPRSWPGERPFVSLPSAMSSAETAHHFACSGWRHDVMTAQGVAACRTVHDLLFHRIFDHELVMGSGATRREGAGPSRTGGRCLPDRSDEHGWGTRAGPRHKPRSDDITRTEGG